MRYGWLFSAVCIAAITTLHTPVRAIDDWPMFHHDAQRTGYSTSEMPDPENIELLWTYTVPSIGIGGAPIHTSPAVADSLVYFVARNQKLYCLDAYDGTLVWTKQLSYDPWYIEPVFDGDWIDPSPCVAEDRVFVAARNGLLYAFDAATGDSVWAGQGSTRELEWLSSLSSPAYENGALYAASLSGYVFKIDPDDGSDICEPFDLSAKGEIFNSPAVDGTCVIIGVGADPDEGGTIESVCWGPHCTKTTLPNPYETGCWVRSTAVIMDGDILQGDGSAGDPRGLLKLSGNALQWSFELDMDEWTCATPAFVDSFIFMARGVDDDSCDVYCLSDGVDLNEVWRKDLGASIVHPGIQCSPAVADGLVFFTVTSDNARLFCLDASNGDILGNWVLGSGEIFSSPAIYDGKVYVGSPGGKLYCFGEAPESRITQASTPDRAPDRTTRLLSRTEVRALDLDLYDLMGRRVTDPVRGMYYLKEGGRVLVVE